MITRRGPVVMGVASCLFLAFAKIPANAWGQSGDDSDTVQANGEHEKIDAGEIRRNREVEQRESSALSGKFRVQRKRLEQKQRAEKTVFMAALIRMPNEKRLQAMTQFSARQRTERDAFFSDQKKAMRQLAAKFGHKSRLPKDDVLVPHGDPRLPQFPP